jgi:hypothetical protein
VLDFFLLPVAYALGPGLWLPQNASGSQVPSLAGILRGLSQFRYELAAVQAERADAGPAAPDADVAGLDVAPGHPDPAPGPGEPGGSGAEVIGCSFMVDLNRGGCCRSSVFSGNKSWCRRGEGAVAHPAVPAQGDAVGDDPLREGAAADVPVRQGPGCLFGESGPPAKAKGRQPTAVGHPPGEWPVDPREPCRVAGGKGQSFLVQCVLLRLDRGSWIVVL